MFEHLSNYRVVLVTGPQRSGTTVCARAVSQDAGLRLVLEEAFGVHDDARWRALVESAQGAVIQCPTMCRYVDEYGDRDDVAVVLMRRPLAEILASQERIRWLYEHLELARYGVESGTQALVKYAYWDEHQRARIRHAYEVQYHDLCKHALWVPAEKRRRFRDRQTSEEATA